LTLLAKLNTVFFTPWGGPDQLNASTSSTSATPGAWQTVLSETAADRISIRGYDLAELIGTIPFSSVLHLLYTGDLPDPSTARLIDAVMVAAIDHGAGTPSVLAARTAISGGATLQAGAAAGLLTLGEFHGAAVESSMLAIGSVVDVAADGDDGLAGAADRLVSTSRGQRRRVPGFGHREHRHRDPRLDRLFAVARDAGTAGEHLAAAEAIEAALTRAVGRRVPINIDGAMAAVLGEIGFPSDLGNAVFIASRLAGILAHANEELRTMAPMRRVDPVDHAYRGPAHRELSPVVGASSSSSSSTAPRSPDHEDHV
jgi:citrate synthase